MLTQTKRMMGRIVRGVTRRTREKASLAHQFGAEPDTFPALERCRICGERELRPHRENGRRVIKRAIGTDALMYACATCGHKQFLPDLRPEQLGPVYADLVPTEEGYGVYYKTLGEPYKSFTDFITEMADRFGYGPDARIHEFGCGTGIVVHHLRERGFRATGSDWSPSTLAFAKAHGNEGVFQESMDTPDQLRGEPFDILVSSHSIEHVPDPVETLRGLVGLLGPRSTMVLWTNHGDGIVNRTDGMIVDPWMYFPLHIHYFSPRSFTALAEQAGAKVVELFTTRREFDIQREALALAYPDLSPAEAFETARQNFQGQELGMVIARADSPLPSFEGALPPVHVDRTAAPRWDSHEDFYREGTPWTYGAVDEQTLEAAGECAYSKEWGYRYRGMTFQFDDGMAHKAAGDGLPLRSFTAPVAGDYTFDLMTALRAPGRTAVDLLVRTPGQEIQTIRVESFTARHHAIRVALAAGERVDFITRALEVPNEQQLVFLAAVR